MRFRCFQVKFIPPTDTKGCRISIHDTRHGDRVYLSFQSESFGDADRFFRRKGIEITGTAETDKHYLFLTEDFTTRIK